MVNRIADPDMLRLLIGVVPLVFVFYQIATQRAWLPEIRRARFFHSSTVWLTLAMAPVAFAGTWIGTRANQIMSDKDFFVITQVLLIGAGTKLEIDGLG